MGGSIRTLILNEDPLFGQTIYTLLADIEDIAIVGELKGEQKVVGLAGELRPDVILLDIEMLYPNNLEMISQILELSPDSKLIMLGGYSQDHLVLEAFRKGAQGHLVKGEGKPLDIVEAIRSVSRGEAVLSPRMAGWILDEMAYQRQHQLEKVGKDR